MFSYVFRYFSYVQLFYVVVQVFLQSYWLNWCHYTTMKSHQKLFKLSCQEGSLHWVNHVNLCILYLFSEREWCYGAQATVNYDEPFFLVCKQRISLKVWKTSTQGTFKTKIKVGVSRWKIVSWSWIDNGSRKRRKF